MYTEEEEKKKGFVYYNEYIVETKNYVNVEKRKEMM